MFINIPVYQSECLILFFEFYVENLPGRMWTRWDDVSTPLTIRHIQLTAT